MITESIRGENKALDVHGWQLAFWIHKAFSWTSVHLKDNASRAENSPGTSQSSWEMSCNPETWGHIETQPQQHCVPEQSRLLLSWKINGLQSQGAAFGSQSTVCLLAPDFVPSSTTKDLLEWTIWHFEHLGAALRSL